MEIYVIKDKVAGTYNTPFFQPTDVHAVRAFRTEVNRKDEQNMIYLYPEEYSLHHIGTYNDDTGEINSKGNGLLIEGHKLKS